MTVPSTTSLTTSHWVADGSGPALRLDLTVGQLLRDVATAVPDRTALIEGTVDPASRRRWTYAQLDRRRALRPHAPAPLPARRADRRVGSEFR